MRYLILVGVISVIIFLASTYVPFLDSVQRLIAQPAGTITIVLLVIVAVALIGRRRSVS